MKTSPQSHDLDGKFIYKGPHVQRVTVAGVDLVFVPGSEHENLPNDEYLKCLVAIGHLEKVVKVKKAAGPEQSQTKPL